MLTHPAPHTLRIKGGDMNADFHWLMSRFAGYVKDMSLFGPPFATHGQSLSPAPEAPR
jgi:hypothetical protein